MTEDIHTFNQTCERCEHSIKDMGIRFLAEDELLYFYEISRNRSSLNCKTCSIVDVIKEED